MIVVALLALAVGSQGLVELSVGQEKTANPKGAPAKVAKKPAGRLPAYYGKVGVSSEQRKKIYSIQAAYKKQIADLQKQIDELKGKQNTEVAAVLTSDQKNKLDEHLAAAKKAAEARSSKSKKKAS
jgi:cell division protein ZapA (FtsZ GTPase activity inhibitor)